MKRLPSYLLIISVLLFGCSGSGGSSDDGGGGVPDDAVSVNDIADSTDVAVDSTFVYTFDEAVTSSTVTDSTFFIVEGSGSQDEAQAMIKEGEGEGEGEGESNPCDADYRIAATVECPTSTQCTLDPTANLLYNNQHTFCLLDSIEYESGETFEGAMAPFMTAQSETAFLDPAPEGLSFAAFSSDVGNAGFAANSNAYLIKWWPNGTISKLGNTQFDLYYTAPADTLDLLQTFSTEVLNDQAYIIGGLKDDGNECPVPSGATYNCATTDTWVYNPDGNTLTAGAAINNARDVAASGVVDGKIYIVGGWNPNAEGSNLDSVEVFDGASWSEVTYTGKFDSVRSPAYAAVGSKVYVFAGCTAMGGCNQTMTQIFDTETNRFHQGADMPLDGRHFSGQHAVARQNRYIYVYGGATDHSETKFDDAAVYDVEANEWQTLSNTMTEERKSCGSVMLGDKLYVSGGGPASTEVGTFTAAE